MVTLKMVNYGYFKDGHFNLVTLKDDQLWLH